jgi:hypothetical protein
MFATIVAQLTFVNQKLDGFMKETKEIREDVNILKRERDVSFGWIAGVSATISVIIGALFFVIQIYLKAKP